MTKFFTPVLLVGIFSFFFPPYCYIEAKNITLAVTNSAAAVVDFNKRVRAFVACARRHKNSLSHPRIKLFPFPCQKSYQNANCAMDE